MGGLGGVGLYGSSFFLFGFGVCFGKAAFQSLTNAFLKPSSAELFQNFIPTWNHGIGSKQLSWHWIGGKRTVLRYHKFSILCFLPSLLHTALPLIKKKTTHTLDHCPRLISPLGVVTSLATSPGNSSRHFMC